MTGPEVLPEVHKCLQYFAVIAVQHRAALGEEPQLSCLLPVTEGGRRVIWKTSEYCRLVDLMKNVIFIQMAHLKSMN